MRGWVQVLLGVMVVFMLLQVILYTRSRLTPYTVTKRSPTVRTGTVPIPGPYSFLTSPPAACTRDTELVMVVVTALDNFDDRAAVRETWGSYAADPAHNVSLVFLLGTTRGAHLQARLANESDHYGDIVQADFVDSYRNLSLKSVALLEWVTLYCNSSLFVLKADDDMYVNVPNLISALRAEQKSTFVMGHVFKGAKPDQNKNSKWYTPRKDFNESFYPKYTSGTAYAMTTKAAYLLFQAAQKVKLFWLEDIYITGLCARRASVPVVHHGGFHYSRMKPTGCTFRKAITGHRYTAADKRKIHEQVMDRTLKCN